MTEARLVGIEKGDDSGVTEVALCGPRLVSQAAESFADGTVTPSIAWPFFPLKLASEQRQASRPAQVVAWVS